MAKKSEPRLLRQWELLMMLSSRRYGMTVDEMAAEAGVNDRTIRRDLATMKQIGFPLEEAVSDHGLKHWKLMFDQTKPPMSFTWEEMISLYMSRRLFEPLAGTSLWHSINSAFRKIRATLGDSTLRYLEQMAGTFHQTAFGAGDYSAQAEVIDALMIGIEDCKFVSITYQSLSATEPVTADIYPYGLVHHSGSLYLIAFARHHDEIRHYKVDRISNAEVQNLQFFTKPPEFDLQEHLANSFGIYRTGGQPVCVRVRFSAEAVRMVEESRWHHSQKIIHQKDGSLLFEVTLDNTTEIRRWLLSFGRQAEVLEPDELRSEIHNELIMMLSRYTARESPTSEEQKDVAGNDDGRTNCESVNRSNELPQYGNEVSAQIRHHH